ncbi:SDR family oxidoreductase [Caulobacter vibrioides]|uniref:SDR family NAD(P)-dependent oxidoreductase n=1 Tax=Caulobacter vibrioides TaxID=155892 RepID=UPI000BB4F418|nr:SDR family oxidoreductase [Caulobacter vibrioides]ATC25342.1 SDR family NAD(P)-dependent oxidoreductase [Caulobacter vibrioides]AZH13431.1 SDR family oxidoreductase [Caulobacter vibrioides]PLR14107.1 NAD(P)-dependent oxidoreductase [Caulobacter vibrioides]
MSKSVQKRSPRYGATALVTGASDGIGEAFARELARRGYNLILVARREDRLRALADAVQSKHGVQARVIAADLGRAEDVERVIAATAAEDVGLLVAAAGFGTSGAFVEQPIEPELDMIDVNCRAVVALTHAFARRFIRRGAGGIVLFGSLVGFQGVPRAANYAATKAFIQSFVEGLRPELKQFGVDVIAVAPGPVASGFAARANMVMGAAAKPGRIPREALAALGRKTTVRPGFLSKALEALFFGLPRGARTLIMTQVMKSMARGTADGMPSPPGR